MEHLPRFRPPALRGALDNAREAAVALATSVGDRLTLTSHLDTSGDDEPGALHVLTRQECYALLSENDLGRIAYVARDGIPDIVPVNYVVDGQDILIRTGPGPKLQAADRHDRVAFEVDVIDPVARTGRSVVVFGDAERLDASQRRRLTGSADTWVSGPRHALLRIRPTRVTGRRLS